VVPPFQHLLDEHAAALTRHLTALVGPEAAADAAQEAFLAALGAYPPRHTANLRGWLYTIAHRKVIDAWRVGGRRTDPVAEVPERPMPAPEPADGALWARVRSLPDAQRAAVVLRYVDDLTYAEIARICGCTEGAARQRVNDALRTLRRTVTQEDR